MLFFFPCGSKIMMYISILVHELFTLRRLLMFLHRKNFKMHNGCFIVLSSLKMFSRCLIKLTSLSNGDLRWRIFNVLIMGRSEHRVKDTVTMWFHVSFHQLTLHELGEAKALIHFCLSAIVLCPPTMPQFPDLQCSYAESVPSRCRHSTIRAC